MARLEFPKDFKDKPREVQDSILSQIEQHLQINDLVLYHNGEENIIINDFQTLKDLTQKDLRQVVQATIRHSKQVLVMRKKFIIDGKTVTPRKGKYVAQGAHASLKAILDQMDWHAGFKYIASQGKDGTKTMNLILDADSALHDWITGSFTKVTVCVETEEDLLHVYNTAVEKKLITALITDAGRTEFNGIPTVTCCSILGWTDEVDEITGKLELL